MENNKLNFNIIKKNIDDSASKFRSGVLTTSTKLKDSTKSYAYKNPINTKFILGVIIVIFMIMFFMNLALFRSLPDQIPQECSQFFNPVLVKNGLAFGVIGTLTFAYIFHRFTKSLQDENKIEKNEVLPLVNVESV